MELFFLRHGESTNNALYKQTGSWEGRDPDPELTPRGRLQAQMLAACLAQPFDPTVDGDRFDPQNRAGYGITHLYCSLMRRAVATAGFIADALELPTMAWKAVHEKGGIFRREGDTGERFGLPGPGPEFFAQTYPELVLPASWEEGGWWGEPYEDEARMAERAQIALKELLERHVGTKDRVAVVSHAGFYQAFLGSIFELPLPDTMREDDHRIWFSLNNAAISRIDFRDSSTSMVYLNRTDHLLADVRAPRAQLNAADT